MLHFENNPLLCTNIFQGYCILFSELIIVKTYKILLLVAMSFCMYGCSSNEVSLKSKEDIRPPLMNTSYFTSFIPVLVTNQMPLTNYYERGNQ